MAAGRQGAMYRYLVTGVALAVLLFTVTFLALDAGSGRGKEDWNELNSARASVRHEEGGGGLAYLSSGVYERKPLERQEGQGQKEEGQRAPPSRQQQLLQLQLLQQAQGSPQQQQKQQRGEQGATGGAPSLLQLPSMQDAKQLATKVAATAGEMQAWLDDQTARLRANLDKLVSTQRDLYSGEVHMREGLALFEEWLAWRREGGHGPRPRIPHFVEVRIQKTATKSFNLDLWDLLTGEGIMACNIGWCTTQAADGEDVNGVTPCYATLPTFLHNSRRSCKGVTALHADYRDLSDGGVPIALIALLRDPVARVVSEYKHLSGAPAAARWDYNPASYEPKNKANFLRFLRDPANALGMRNRQTRMLAGCGAHRCENLYLDEEEMLDTAKRHLEQGLFVGISERYEETIRLLYHRFAKEIPDSLKLRKVKNVHDGKDEVEIDEDIIAAVLETNSLDVQLYDHACKLFDSRYVAAFANELDFEGFDFHEVNIKLRANEITKDYRREYMQDLLRVNRPPKI